MKRGRRSDHTADELLELVLHEGSALVAEVGIAGYSARELGRRIGYSVSTVLKVTGGADALFTAVNTRTMATWADALDAALALRPANRIAAMVRAYFRFALGNQRLWRTIYDVRVDEAMLPADQAETRARLTGIVAREVGATMPGWSPEAVAALTRSLIAIVHGHCDMAIGGNLAVMGDADGMSSALRCVEDVLAAARAGPPR